METTVIYLLKWALCLAVFYLFNRMLLERETFHRLNRITWLVIIPVSLFLPLFTFNVWELLNSPALEPVTTDVISQIPIEYQSETPDTLSDTLYYLIHSLFYIYIMGVAFFASRLFYCYYKLLRMAKKGETTTVLEKCKEAVGVMGNVHLVLQSGDSVPFSWMNFIFIGEEDLINNGEAILRHELSHIKNKHSYDIVLVDIMLVFQWFNPAAWLFKRSLQQVHEFQADEQVIVSGVNTKEYQLLLIKKGVGQRMFSMANSFNYSKLKNRLNMMAKQKSKNGAYLKYLYMFPLAMAVVSAYASPAVSSKISIVKYNFEERIESVDTAKTKIRVVGVKNEKMPLYVLDGEEVASVENINPDDIKNITVLKDKTAIEVYGEKGKNGVIIISTNNNKEIKAVKADTVVVNKRDAKTTINEGNAVFKIKPGDGKSPLYIVDGVEAVTGNINPDTIESIRVLKDTTAVRMYGEKGRNGVFIIKTKGKVK